MFFAGKGKGGLQVLFGVAATAGLFWGLHLLGAAGLKAGGAAAGVDLYGKLVAQPSEWLAGAFKSAVNGFCGVMGWSGPSAFAGAGDAFIPPGATDSLSNGTSWLKSKLGFGSQPFLTAPAELMPG